MRLEKTASIADGLLTLQPGALTFAHIQAFVDEIVTVEEGEIVEAMQWLFERGRDRRRAKWRGQRGGGAESRSFTRIGNGCRDLWRQRLV